MTQILGPCINKQLKTINLLVCGLLFNSAAVFSAQLAASKDLFSLSLEELMSVDIESSGFFAMPANQSPGSVWVFSEQELNSSPIVYLRDLFENYVPSTTISYSRFAGPIMGVRGISTDNNSKTLFMVNGQNLNLKNHYGYQAGLHSVLFGDMERVEVILGPGSLLHGSGAINSLVNLISKNGSDHQGLTLNANYGVQESLAALEAGYGIELGEKRNIYIYGGVANADGLSPDSLMEFDNYPTTTYRNPNDDSAYQLDNLRLSSYISWDNIHFQTQFQQIKSSLNRYIPSPTYTTDGEDYYYQTFWASQFQYDWQLNNHSHIEFVVPLELIDHGIKFWNRDYEKSGRQNHLGIKSTYFYAQDNNKFATGFAVAQRQFEPGKQYFGGDSDYSEETVNADLIETEVFGEYTWQATDKFSVIAGLRFDHVSYSKMSLEDKQEAPSAISFDANNLSAFSKRLAASYIYSAQQTYKLSYQEGFRYPDVGYFRYIGLINASLAENDYAALPTPKEETVKSLQFSYLQSFSKLPLELDITTYYNRYNNLIDWGDWPASYFTSDDEFEAAYAGLPWNSIGNRPREDWSVESYQNINSEINAWGIELASEWQASNSFSVRATYAFSRPASINENENTLVLLNSDKSKWASFPEHLVKLSANHNFAHNWHYNVSFYYGSAVDICTTNDCDLKPEVLRHHEQDRVRVNLKLSNQLNKQLRVNFVVQNAFADNGAPVGAESRYGLANRGAWGDDEQRIYLGLNWAQ